MDPAVLPIGESRLANQVPLFDSKSAHEASGRELCFKDRAAPNRFLAGIGLS